MYNNYNSVDWKSIVEYDENSPSGLSWKINIMSGKYQQIQKIKTGDFAGNKHFQGKRPHAWTIGYKGERYYIHRIVWILKFENIPDNMVIDHIDGNPFNNKITNLRLVTQHVNARNRKLLPQNKTGVNGVCINSKHRKSGKIDTYIVITWKDYKSGKGKYKRKAFDILDFNSQESALEFGRIYREDIIANLNDGSPEYTERHGTYE